MGTLIEPRDQSPSASTAYTVSYTYTPMIWIVAESLPVQSR